MLSVPLLHQATTASAGVAQVREYEIRAADRNPAAPVIPRMNHDCRSNRSADIAARRGVRRRVAARRVRRCRGHAIRRRCTNGRLGAGVDLADKAALRRTGIRSVGGHSLRPRGGDRVLRSDLVSRHQRPAGNRDRIPAGARILESRIRHRSGAGSTRRRVWPAGIAAPDRPTDARFGSPKSSAWFWRGPCCWRDTRIPTWCMRAIAAAPDKCRRRL
jgi:hypothetical protein